MTQLKHFIAFHAGYTFTREDATAYSHAVIAEKRITPGMGFTPNRVSAHGQTYFCDPQWVKSSALARKSARHQGTHPNIMAVHVVRAASGGFRASHA
jgi:hypothetical protein